MGSYRPSKSKSRPHGRSVLAVLVKSQPVEGRICCQSLPAVLVKSQPDEERSCCQSLPAVLVKSQPEEGDCYQSVSAARVKSQPEEERVVVKVCWLCPLKTSLLV